MDNGYSLEVGDSFEIVDGNGPHLHFIIAEASKTDHSSIILVYLSSSNTIYKDPTTIIRYGEHPYVTKTEDESWIRYQNTKQCSRGEIAPLIVHHFGKVSDELLRRIQTGFESSTKVDRYIKKSYFEWKENKLFESL